MIDIITLLKYQEGSLDSASRIQVDKYLSTHTQTLEEIMDLDRIAIVMDKGDPLPLPGKAFIQINIIQGLIDSFHCEGANAGFVPVIATRGDARPDKHEKDKNKIKVNMKNVDVHLEILSVRGNAYWVMVDSPILKGHVVKLKRKGDDYSLYTKKASSSSVTIKGLGAGEYEVLFLDDSIDISIVEH